MSWRGVKNQSLKSNIEAWCDEVGIEDYTINSQGEIDVDGHVDLDYKDFKELPFKFGIVKGYFDMDYCKNLISLKNCPDYVGLFFRCDDCPQLDSLEGCPKKVDGNFYCVNCKKEFVEEEVRTLCKVKYDIFNKIKL